MSIFDANAVDSHAPRHVLLLRAVRAEQEGAWLAAIMCRLAIGDAARARTIARHALARVDSPEGEVLKVLDAMGEAASEVSSRWYAVAAPLEVRARLACWVDLQLAKRLFDRIRRRMRAVDRLLRLRARVCIADIFAAAPPGTRIEINDYDVLAVLGGPVWETQVVSLPWGSAPVWCGEQQAGDELWTALAPLWRERTRP